MGEDGRPLGGPVRWILGLGAANLVLATVGYAQYLDDGRFSDALFHALNLMFLNYHVVEGATTPPLPLDIARYAAHAIAGTAIVLAILTLLRERLDRWRVGRARGHVTVVGTPVTAAELAGAYRRGARATGRRHTVCLFGPRSRTEREQLRRHGVRVVDGGDDALARVVRHARRIVVLGEDDDETLRWAGRLPPTAGTTHLVVDDRDLASELRHASLLLEAGTVDVCCAAERVAAHVLSLDPPRRDGHVAPPPVVVGTGVLAAEVVRRMAFGWQQPGDPLPIVCAGPEMSWADDLAGICRGRAALEVRDDVRTVRQARELVAAVAATRRPPARLRQRRHEDGVLVVVVGLGDAATVTLATKVLATVDRARVIAVVDGRTPFADHVLDRGSATGSTLRVVSRRELLTTPAVIEADHTRRLAEELHLDATRWPADDPSPLGAPAATAFDQLPADRRGRLVEVATVALAAVDDELTLDDEGTPVVLGPVALASLAARLAPAVAQPGAATSPGEVPAQLRLAAMVPLLLARVGLVVRPRDDTDALDVDRIETMAAEAHRQYLLTQERFGNITGSELASQAWDELDAFARESNRSQVRDIPLKLASVGLALEPGVGGGTDWLDAATIERLARWEHTRWVHLHRCAGYRPGPETDHAARVHEHLVAWDDLAEHPEGAPGPKELDRSVVAAIPDILAAAALRAVPATAREP